MTDASARIRSDARIAETLIGESIWRSAQIVYIYLSFGSEVETRPIIERAWRSGKRVRVPRCERGTSRLSWHEIGSLEGLRRSAFGIPEPACSVDAVELPAAARLGRRGADACDRGSGGCLAVVPALAVDARGYRLGYGGGCYDRFLSVFGGPSVGLCRRAQLLDSLADVGAVEVHDVPVGFIATDRGFIVADRARRER